MDQENNESLESRIKRLEDSIEEIRSLLEKQSALPKEKPLPPINPEPIIEKPLTAPTPPLDTGPKPTAPPPPTAEPEPAIPSPPRPIRSFYSVPVVQRSESAKGITIPAHMRKGEYWLNKVGITLLLLSIIFLFKYSVDQGWLTPRVRIGFGYALGIFLIVMGLRIFPKRPHFSQVLLGGGIATFYITGFAAFQIFSLMPRPMAMGFMIMATMLAFILSLKLDGMVLAIIGVLGGLGTPVFLYTGAESVPGFILYTCLVITGMIAVYFYRGWRPLLWITLVGGWMVFAGGIIVTLIAKFVLKTPDRWALEGGVLFGAIAFWFIPVIRDLVQINNHARWLPISLGFGKPLAAEKEDDIRIDLHVLTVFTPLTVLALSYMSWNIHDKQFWGWCLMAGALVYGLMFMGIRKQGAFMNRLAYTHAISGIALFTVSLALVLDGQVLFTALVMEAAAIHLVAHRLEDRGLRVSGHILFFIVAIWMTQRVFAFGSHGAAILNKQALSDILAVAIGIFISRLFKTIHERNFYLILALAFIAGILIRELSGDILLASLVAQAVIVHYLGGKFGNKALTPAGHVLYALILGRLLERLLITSSSGMALFNVQALTDIFAIASLIFMAVILKHEAARRIYLITSQFLIVFLLAREFSGDLLVFLISIQLLVLHAVRARYTDEIFAAFTHISSFAFAFLIAFRIINSHAIGVAVFNWQAFVDLWSVAVLTAISLRTGLPESVPIYRIAAHILLLGWFGRELYSLPNGQAYVSIAWGADAVILLIIGLRRNLNLVRIIALATLGLVIGKLFLVDLARLKMIWRILLFMGFGGVFLVLSYYFQSMWKGRPDNGEEATAKTEL